MTLAPHITNKLGVIDATLIALVPKPRTPRTATLGFYLSGARCNAARSDAEGRRNHSKDRKPKDKDTHPGGLDLNYIVPYLKTRLVRSPGYDGGDPNDRNTDDDFDSWDQEADDWFDLLDPAIQDELRSEHGFQVGGHLRQLPVNPANFCKCESERFGYDDAMNHRAPGVDLDYFDEAEVGYGKRKRHMFSDADTAVEFYIR